MNKDISDSDTTVEITIKSITKFNGDIVRYDGLTNTFGVMSKAGILRTTYKPVTGFNEFLRTVNLLPEQ